MTRETHLTDDQPRSILAKLLRPKVAFPLLFLFLLVSSPWLIRGWFLRGVPNPPEPFDATPLLEYSVPDDENAFTDYRLATSLYVPPSRDVSNLRDRIYDEGWHLANDDVRQFLRDNEGALLVWKRGTEKNEALYIPAKDYHLAVVTDVSQELRELHRTVMLLCRKLEAEGKPGEAWEWYRASVRASRHTGMQGGIVERLTGTALFHMAAYELETWAAHPDLTAEDLKLAMEQLQADWQLTEKPSTTLQLEYLSLDRAMENAVKGARLPGMSLPGSPNLMHYLGEPELSRRLCRSFFYNQLAFCDLPRSKRPRQAGIFVPLYDNPRGFSLGETVWSAAEFDVALQRSTYARHSTYVSDFLRPTASIVRTTDREIARYYTLLATLAGQAFRRDRGRFPKTLDELVPEYLEAVPIDNYDGKPLKYRFDPGGPVVYSVFENLADDGGFEWNDNNRRTANSDQGSQMRLPEPKPLVAPRP